MSQDTIVLTILDIYRILCVESETISRVGNSLYEACPRRAICVLSNYYKFLNQAGYTLLSDHELCAERFFALLQAEYSLKCQLGLVNVPAVAKIEPGRRTRAPAFMKAHEIGRFDTDSVILSSSLIGEGAESPSTRQRS